MTNPIDPEAPAPESEPKVSWPTPTVSEAIIAAAIFLTRVPLTLARPFDRDLFGRAMGWFPAIGTALGLGAGILFGLLRWFGLPPELAATLTITALVAITGGLHEDGLADTADGFGGGRDRQHKLEIMRDSRLGSYGALALILSLALRIGAVASLPTTWAVIVALTVASTLSRGAMVATSHWLPMARADGLSATLGGPARSATLQALALAAGVAVLLLGTKAVLVLAVAVAGTLALLKLARTEIGGQTGDVLGAVQQVVETAILVVLVGLK